MQAQLHQSSSSQDHLLGFKLVAVEQAMAPGNQRANNGNPHGSRALGLCRLAHMWL